jgi:hypothetical protein
MRIAALLLFAALSGCAEAQSPPNPEGTVEIIDGRVERPYLEHSEWEGHPAIRSARGAAQDHWRSRDAGFEEEFRVLGVAEGAFTRPDARQQAVLYLMSTYPRADPKTGIAVVEGDALVRNVALGGATGLVAVPDLDGDGRNELALLYTYGMGGSTETGLTLVSLAEGRAPREWKRTELAQNSCAMAGSPHAQASAVRLLAAPGPAFMAERYEDPSCEGQWARAGDPEPVELYPSEEGAEAYTDLPVR